MNRKQWTNLINEGGEGYNPYPRKAEAAEPLYWKLIGQRDRLLKIMESVSLHDSRYAEYEAQVAELKAKIAEEKARQ